MLGTIRRTCLRGQNVDARTFTLRSVWQPSRAAKAVVGIFAQGQGQLRSYADAIYKGNKPDVVTLDNREVHRRISVRQREVLGNLSAASKKLGQEVLSGELDAAKYLRDEDAAGRITSEKVRICLTSSLKRISNVHRKKRHKFFAREPSQLARTVLDILWRDQELWLPIVIFDADSRIALCYFAIWEQLDGLVIRWLNVDIGSTIDVDEKFLGWRGWLLAAMVRAILMQDTTSDATRALELLFELADEKRRLRESSVQSPNGANPGLLAGLSMFPATRTLGEELSRWSYERTDPSLYSRFVGFYKGCPPDRLTTRLSFEWNLAGMSMRHPASPRIDHMLHLLRKHMGPDRTSADLDAFHIEIGLTEPSWRNTVSCLRRLLLEQGRSNDAEWVQAQLGRPYFERPLKAGLADRRNWHE